MDQLDISPMIAALRTNPDHFCFVNGSLNHIPSAHYFKFDSFGRVNIHTACACSQLGVTREQENALYQAYNTWQMSYWRPLQINRQFAEHFQMPWWRRVLVSLTGYLHRALLKGAKERHEAEAVTVPAE